MRHGHSSPFTWVALVAGESDLSQQLGVDVLDRSRGGHPAESRGLHVVADEGRRLYLGGQRVEAVLHPVSVVARQLLLFDHIDHGLELLDHRVALIDRRLEGADRGWEGKDGPAVSALGNSIWRVHAPQE